MDVIYIASVGFVGYLALSPLYRSLTRRKK